MDCSPPGSSVHGILQARILEWVAIPFSRGSSWPRDRTQVFLKYRQILYRLSHLGSPSVWEAWTDLLWYCVFDGHIPKGGSLLESFKTWRQTQTPATQEAEVKVINSSVSFQEIPSCYQFHHSEHPLPHPHVQRQAKRNVPVGDTKPVPQDKPQETGP